MPETDEIARSPVTDDDLEKAGLPTTMKMAPGLALYFNDRIYNRVKAIATHMAHAEGVTPKHLINKPEACFAVCTRAITWNLDPQAVAMATYQTPGGTIGYEGRLVQAILENSGRLEGRVSFTFDGDWGKIRGKFKIETSAKGNKYPVPSWKPEDEAGLAVTVSAKVKGEAEPREEKFFLDEMFPRNSTLWATRPRQQICYAAVRAFASIAAPGLLMGIPFDVDPTDFYGEPMVDITPPPRPTRENEFSGGHAKVEGTAQQVTGQQTNGTAAQAEPVEEEEPQSEAQASTAPAEDKQDAAPTGPLQRGLALLPNMTSTNAVGDLRKTIGQELTADADRKAWDTACDSRSRQIVEGKRAAKNGQKQAPA